VKRALLAFLVLLNAACAHEPPTAPRQDSLLPGNIGVTVGAGEAGVVVYRVAKGGGAEKKGVRPGDVVLRFNGEPISSVREFNRLVVDSRPGSFVRLELVRDGSARSVELPVEQLDTTPRAAVSRYSAA
jgi:S1-C subfamily serine protease